MEWTGRDLVELRQRHRTSAIMRARRTKIIVDLLLIGAGIVALVLFVTGNGCGDVSL